MKAFFISLSILFLIPNFLKVSLGNAPVYDKKETFDPTYAYINTIDKLIDVADSTARQQAVNEQSVAYAVIVNNIISKHFYHGFSHFTLAQNWIAATGEYCLGHNLSCKVEAADILQHPYAGCSQQSIVLMEVMKRKHISYRSVGFPHHYALELMIDGKWNYFDPNMEPRLSVSDRSGIAQITAIDSFRKYYDTTHYTDLDWKFGHGKVELGQVNSVVAPHAKLFQSSAWYMSKTLWLFPLMIAFYPRKKKSTVKK